MLVEKAEEIHRPGAVVVQPQDELVFYVLYGWWRFINRSAVAFWRLHDGGFPIEGLPLVRNILDHTYSMMWLRDAGPAGVTVLGGVELEKRRKLINNVKQEWKTLEDFDASTLPPITVPAEGDPGYDAYCTMLGEFKNFSNLITAYGRGDAYPVYRVLSNYSHAGTQTAEAYLEPLQDGKYELQAMPRTSGSHGPIIHTTIALIQAGDVMSGLMDGDPMRKLLKQAANDIGLGTPELLRDARKKPLPSATA
ncbi:DUF5677 domain-containing protein [Planomonospora algeriensis]